MNESTEPTVTVEKTADGGVKIIFPSEFFQNKAPNKRGQDLAFSAFAAGAVQALREFFDRNA